MDEEETVAPASEEETTEELHLDTSPSEEDDEDVEAIKAKLTKTEELAKNYKIRAEKAEGKNKTEKVETKKDLSSTDLYTLLKADVHQEDIQDVTEYADFKKISVAEALKTGAVKALLADKEEQRKVAAATNSGPVKRNAASQTDEALQERASKGEMPSSDTELDRLIKARKGIK